MVSKSRSTSTVRCVGSPASRNFRLEVVKRQQVVYTTYTATNKEKKDMATTKGGDSVRRYTWTCSKKGPGKKDARRLRRHREAAAVKASKDDN